MKRDFLENSGVLGQERLSYQVHLNNGNNGAISPRQISSGVKFSKNVFAFTQEGVAMLSGQVSRISREG